MLRLVLLLLVAGMAAAIHFLPWWAGAGLLLAVPVLGWFAFKRAASGLLMGAFKAKSAVLKGAKARIHSISPAPPFKPEGEAEEAMAGGLEDPHHWVYIDLDVLAPEVSDSPMDYWDASELAIVGEHAKPDDYEADEAVGQVYGVERLDGQHWVRVEEKLAGSQRLRLHVSARAGIDRFHIRYYFELLKNAG